MKNGFSIGSKLTAGFILLTVSSCVIDKCEEAPPMLKFQQYEYKAPDPNTPSAADTLTLVFSFIDCQGDVGIPSSEETKNLQTFMDEWINGEWTRFIAADSSLLFAQVPASSKIKKGQKIEGKIEQPFGSIRQNSDTVRFETRLIDQEGNVSNTVVTPQFVFPN